jgi:hypothetical protein
MGRGGVEVKVAFFDILAVVSLRPGKAEKPLFEDGIPAVPKRQREAHSPLAITNAEKPVLPPTVGAAAGMFVRKVAPHLAFLGVVFANRPPLSLREVRPPALPVLFSLGVLGEPPGLCVVCSYWIHAYSFSLVNSNIV